MPGRLALACFLLGTLFQAGCGGDAASNPRPQIRAAVAAAAESFDKGSFRATCARLSHQARIEIGSVAHQNPTTCVRDLRAYAELLRLGPKEAGRPRLSIGDIAVDGDRARAALRVDGRPAGRLPIVDTDDGWKLEYVAGVGQPNEPVTTDPRDVLPVATPVGAKTAPRRGRPSSPCPAIEVKERRLGPSSFQVESRGGCLLYGTSERVKIVMRTVLGTIDFGTCDGRYELRVDGSGRTWVHSLYFSGNSGCPDVTSCEESRLDPLWQGRNHGEGRLLDDPRRGLLNVIHACISTCVGRFEGVMVLKLYRHRGAWRARPAHTTHPMGIELPGTWKFSHGDFRIFKPA